MAEIVKETKVGKRATKRPHEEDKPWRNWKRMSSLGVFLVIEIPCKDYSDLTVFLNDIKNNIHDIIVEELGKKKALKFYLTVQPKLSRSNPDGNETSSTPHLSSLPSIASESSDIRKQIDEACERIVELLDTHEESGSRFSLDCILKCYLNIATYDIIGGSTNTPLPKFIQSKKATVTIKSDDKKNFLRCLSYVRNPPVKDPQRLSKYIGRFNSFQYFRNKVPRDVESNWSIRTTQFRL